MMENDVDVSSSMVMIGMPSDGLECRWIGALANLGTEREGGGRSGRMMRGLRRTCVREGMGGVGCEGWDAAHCLWEPSHACGTLPTACGRPLIAT